MLNEMSNAQLQAIVDLTEARILKISKDDLRMTEEQLMWTPDLKVEVLKYWNDLNTYWANKKLPPCTCHVHEGGFLAKPDWNGYYFNGQPCSIDWLNKCKQEGLLNGGAN